jgi:hypothetical protein
MNKLFRGYFCPTKFKKKPVQKFIKVRFQNRIRTFLIVGFGSCQKLSESASSLVRAFTKVYQTGTRIHGGKKSEDLSVDLCSIYPPPQISWIRLTLISRYSAYKHLQTFEAGFLKDKSTLRVPVP